jgi:hypothetical protein
MAAKKAARKTQTIKSPGKTPVTFKKGGLHESLGVPQGQKIPAGKMAAAQAGKYGPKAKQQANFAQGMLKAGRQTAAKGRGKAKGK